MNITGDQRGNVSVDGLKAWNANTKIKEVDINMDDVYIYKVTLKDGYSWGLHYTGKFKTRRDVNRALRTVTCQTSIAIQSKS